LADGIVESAVGLFLENGDLGATSQHAPAAVPQRSVPAMHDYMDEDGDDDAAPLNPAMWQDEVRAPIAPRRDVLIGGSSDDEGPMGMGFGVYGRHMRTFWWRRRR
jgi:hypothetical protein